MLAVRKKSLNQPYCYCTSFVLSLYLCHTFCRIYYSMNKNTALLFLFAILDFHFSLFFPLHLIVVFFHRFFCCSTRFLFFFVAVLASFFRRCASSLFLVAILASLLSRCLSSLLSLLSSRCCRYVLLVIRRYFLVALIVSRCSCCSTSLLLFFTILIRWFVMRRF